MRAKVLSAATLCTLLSAPALAQEPPPPAGGEMPPPSSPPPVAAGGAAMAAGFGEQGQIALSVDLPFTNSAPQLAIVRESQSMGGSSTTVVAIAPSADYFVIPNLSIGGIIGVATGSTDVGGGVSADTTKFIISPRIGYVVRLADSLSLWPRLGIQYVHTSLSSGGQSATESSVPLIVDVPVLWHPVPHFFMGAGFLVATELTNSGSSGGVSMDQPKTTDIGLEAMIGGYFGGT